MAIAWVAAGTANQSQTGGTVAHPAGIATNDILILAVEYQPGLESAAVTITGGGGTWTEFTAATYTNTGSQVGYSPGTGTAMRVWWSRYDGSQAAPTITDPTDHVSAVIFAYSGVKTSGNPHNIQVGGSVASTTTPSYAGVTTTANDCMIVIVACDPTDSGTNQFSNFANGNLTAVTQRINQNTALGGGGGLGSAEGIKVAAGATGNTTATLATAGASGFATIALEPAAVVTGLPDVVMAPMIGA